MVKTIKARWPRVAGVLLVAATILHYVTSALDWGGRIEFIHTHIASTEPLWKLLATPPPWAPLAVAVIGIGLILWDIRRTDTALIARLAALGWTVKPEHPDRPVFEINSRPLPPMEKSARYFRRLTKPFSLHFQSVESLEGLHLVAPARHCLEISIAAGEFTDISEVRDFEDVSTLSISQLPLNGRGFVDAGVLSSLHNLEKLNLYGTRILDLGFVASLHKLKTLSVGDTAVTDIEPVTNLHALESVTLRGSRVTDLRPLDNLSNLKELEMGVEQLEGLRTMRGPERITRALITGQMNFDLSPFGRLSNLEHLVIWGPPRPDVRPLSGLTKLRTLSLSSFAFGTVVQLPPLDLTALGQLRNLETFALGSLPVWDISFMATLTKLTELSLMGLPISSIEPLRGLTSLKTLTMVDIGSVEIAPLQQLPSLAKLTVIRCPVRADILSELDRRGVNVHR